VNADRNQKKHMDCIICGTIETLTQKSDAIIHEAFPLTNTLLNFTLNISRKDALFLSVNHSGEIIRQILLGPSYVQEFLKITFDDTIDSNR
jgi:hypothetical protein